MEFDVTIEIPSLVTLRTSLSPGVPAIPRSIGCVIWLSTSVAESADARHAESGLRAGASMDRATMRGIFWEHVLAVDAARKTIRADGGPEVTFTGEETDLLVEDERGRSLYVDVTGLHPGFHGQVQTGVLGRVRNVYFSSFLTQ